MLDYTTYTKINEAKNVGLIYHFTNLYNLFFILKDNKLISNNKVGDRFKKNTESENIIEYYQFSFTRDKNFHNKENLLVGNFCNVRITLDGTKMSNIKGGIFPTNYFIAKRVEHLYKHEAEECIISTNNEINNIKQYIIEIEIKPLTDDNYWKEFYRNYHHTKKTNAIMSDIYGFNIEHDYNYYDQIMTNDKQYLTIFYEKLVEYLKRTYPEIKIRELK